MINRNEFKASYDRLGLNQNDVASRIGVNPTTLQRKLNGTSDFNRNEIQLLKSGLKLSVDQVVNIFLPMTCIYARINSKKEIYKWVERSKRMANLSTRFNSIDNEKVFPAISEAVGRWLRIQNRGLLRSGKPGFLPRLFLFYPSGLFSVLFDSILGK